MNNLIAQTPAPPYYAVIFTSVKTTADEEYAVMADRMVELAAQQNGYLGHESAREEIGITVSYWRNLEDIKQWKSNAEHIIAQQLGKEKWYAAYTTRICLVERAYTFEHP